MALQLEVLHILLLGTINLQIIGADVRPDFSRLMMMGPRSHQSASMDEVPEAARQRGNAAPLKL
jgi:hypothetical protein